VEDKNKLGDAPIQPEYHKQMNDLARFLDREFNPNGKKDVGFVMLVFPYGEKDGRCNFISNGADRKDIVCMFREMIARFEGQPEIQGNA
jgi:hypothetical protein